MDNCLLCQRIEAIKNGVNKNFICELETSYVVLGDTQYYKGYTLLLSKCHCFELHELEQSVRLKFLEEMAMVGEVIFKLFQPAKLNYELLGNRHPHLHWHIFPRYVDDADKHNPIWITSKAERNHTFLSDAVLEKRVEAIRTAILNHISDISFSS